MAWVTTVIQVTPYVLWVTTVVPVTPYVPLVTRLPLRPVGDHCIIQVYRIHVSVVYMYGLFSNYCMFCVFTIDPILLKKNSQGRQLYYA